MSLRSCGLQDSSRSEAMITGKDIVKYIIWVSFVLTILALCVTFLPRAGHPQTPKSAWHL
jgi:hypothetical protein